MLEFDIKSVHKMVNQQRSMGVDVRWENYDVIFFRPADHAMYSADGEFRNGVWGFSNRFGVNSDGKWKIDSRNLKRHRRARS